MGPKACRTVVALIGIVAAACSGEASRGGAPRTAIDALGDTIVARTTGSPPAASLHRLIVEWRSGAGSADEPTGFAGISEVAVARDGRVYTWDPRTPSLRYYDATGKLIKTFGRKGSGPGEYTTLNGLTVLPDGRVVAWDMGNARLNVYSADGVTITAWRAPMSGYGTSGALLADTASRLWATGWVSSIDRDWSILGRGAWFVVDTTGAVVDTVLQPEPNRGDAPLIARAQGGMTSRDLPFGRAQAFAVSPLGALIWGPSDPFRIHAADGGRPVRIEREWTNARVSDEERAQHRASVEWGMRRTEPAWTWRGRDVPATKPAYWGIRVGGDGRIWVALNSASVRYTPDPIPSTRQSSAPQIQFRDSLDLRDVFEPGGQYRGRVVVPGNVRLFAMRGDSVWGVMTDADDVPSLVKMRIVPGFTGNAGR